MTTFRALLLLLLALLLPLRGAAAGLMLCDAGLPATAMVEAMQMAPHAPAAAHEGDGTAPCHEAQAEPGHAGSCTLCASCCGAPALIAALPVLGTPQRVKAGGFPALALPAVLNTSRRQDRPPRSL